MDTRADTATTELSTGGSPSTLHREIDWRGAFWAISGVPAGVLITVGPVAAVIGQPAWAIWIASVMLGFLQSFVYAEIAGLYPHKSGGASVYGAAAWLNYSKYVAPISVWCNWLAWSPVLALGTSLGAAYVVTSLFPANAAINQWHIQLLDLGFIQSGLSLRINLISIIGTLFLLATFYLQHHGAARAARAQKIMAIVCLSPLIVVGLVPFLTGDLPHDRIFPLLPLAHDAAGGATLGQWNAHGVTLAMAALFMAAWSTYGFEGAVCYTREFRNPGTDTYKAILSAGLLCMVVFTLVPFSFQVSLGLKGLLDPAIYDGTGVAQALAHIVRGGAIVNNLLIAIFILGLLLIVGSSMMGSSRTLYQASVDGWLPRYLSRVNHHGAPTAAMWTDLAFNLILLLMSDYVAVLAISNVCYIIFNFLNLQAGWIHRLDRPDWPRPFRAPTWLIVTGAVLGFVNLVFVGAGANVYGRDTLRNGLIAAALILPVFLFRHFIQDRGHFPLATAQQDRAAPGGDRFVGRAGVLTYLTLAAACITIWIGSRLAVP